MLWEMSRAHLPGTQVTRAQNSNIEYDGTRTLAQRHLSFYIIL